MHEENEHNKPFQHTIKMAGEIITNHKKSFCLKIFNIQFSKFLICL
jgi:hypothetical protein